MTVRGLVASVLLLIASIASAQPEFDSIDDRRTLTAESMAAFEARDWARAEAACRRLTEVDGANFVPWYNLACALSLQDRAEEAEAALLASIARGFIDRIRLESDPHLTNLRDGETYGAIIDGWDRIVEKRASANFEALAEHYGPRYRRERDEALRLQYLSGFSDDAFEGAKAEIVRLTAWWESVVLPGAEPWRAKEGAGGTPPWVVVLLPTRDDYASWAIQRYGQMWEQIGGAYSNDEKQLVSKDLGSTLRHEYWHVLHWRHMNALGQRHPVWIMEGLCSLVEDVEPEADGLVPLPSWRTNMARRLARAGRLTPWDTLFGMTQKDFVSRRPLAFYAQARTVFMYLTEQDKLGVWYDAYVRGFAEDPTGARAMEAAFGQPIEQTERAYKAWLRAMPEADDEIRPGEAQLPFSVRDNSGAGLTIVSITTGATRRAGVRRRDVVTSVAGTPVRDLNDLARALSPFKPGDEVELIVERRGARETARITLTRER